MDSLKVSIIVPVYNAELYLKECFDSLRKQSWDNIEILFVNDGSTDGSAVLLDGFALEDPRVRVFHKENGGTHTARNLGLVEAVGEYVTFIDPDDWLDLDTIQTCMEKVAAFDLDVVRYTYVREFENSSEIKHNTFLPETVCDATACRQIARQTIGLLGEELKHPENMNFLASVCFSIYRKSLILDNGITFFNIREIGTFSDGLFNIEGYLKMNRFLYIDKGFYHYRKTNSQSATSNYRQDFDRKQGLLYEKIYDLIQGYDAVYCEAYYSRISMSTLEIALNVFKQKANFRTRYRELKEICNNPLRIRAYEHFALSTLPLAYKVFHLLAKERWTFVLYFYTWVIRIKQISR